MSKGLEALRVLPGYLLVYLPIVLPFVRRGAPVFLIAAGLVQLLLKIRSQKTPFRKFICPNTTFLFFWMFMCWAVVSLIWTPLPYRAGLALLNSTLVVLAYLALSNSRIDLPVAWEKIFAVAITIGALVICADLTFMNGWLLHMIHSRPEAYRYNMVVASLVVLIWPVCSLSLRTPAKGLAIIAVIAAISLSESESAKVAALVGGLSFLFSLFIPPKVRMAIYSIALVALALTFPYYSFVAKQAEKVIPNIYEAGHASERLGIWSAFSDFALAGLPFGWGVESVSGVPMHPYFSGVSDQTKYFLNYMHPHNNLIQIAVELGLPGLILALMVLVLWGRTALQRNDTLAPAIAGFAGSVATIAFVSHGLWQTWWWSTILIALLLFKTPALSKND